MNSIEELRMRVRGIALKHMIFDEAAGQAIDAALDALIVAIGHTEQSLILEAMKSRRDACIPGSAYLEIRRYVEMIRSVETAQNKREEMSAPSPSSSSSCVK